MLPALLALLACVAAMPLKSTFQHSDHHAPLSRRHHAGLAGLRRRGGHPRASGKANLTSAETPTAEHVRGEPSAPRPNVQWADYARVVQTIGFDIQGPAPGVDWSYVADVELGTSPTTYSLVIDSGSSDLWVSSEACTNCNHKPLGPRSSSTFVGSDEPWSITYGYGAANGTLCTDTLTIAGFTLKNYKFGKPVAVGGRPAAT